MAETCASARSRDEQLAGANQIACRQFGITAGARASANGLERGCKLRVELHRLARRFAEPFPASLHTTDKASAASKTKHRSCPADTARRGFGTQAQGASPAGAESDYSRRRGAD